MEDLHRLDRVEQSLKEHLTDCEKQNAEVRRTLVILMEGHETIEAAIDSFKSAAWKGFLALVGVLTVSAGTVLVQNFQITSKETKRAEVAAATQDRYTAEDAARDRAETEEREAKLEQAIKEIRRDK